MSVQPMNSRVRRVVLQELAGSDTPLTLTDLSQRVDVSPHTVRSALKRPRVGGWVTAMCTRGSPELHFRITDLGRQWLAQQEDGEEN